MGLFGAGDAVGGTPHAFSSGSFTEGRLAAKAACKYVDEVVMNIGGKDSKIAIELAQPDYILIGSDWAKKDYYSQMGFDQDWLDYKGIGLIYVPYTKEISSTNIKRRMQ